MVDKISTLEKPIVYIVDDDLTLQGALSTRLQLHGLKVEVFESAEDFLATKLRSRASCLIVEVNLPKMDGIALLKHINNLGVRLPTIVLSSGSDVTDAVRAMQAKAVDFIEKPFVENTLVKKILDVIERS
ncbi:response regulator [uncultured Paraglaciecola sp.]|uniref:response regulator transcription factor n=1 Tax=uncultured Paraglaciecola sp. TaxID=1765024 RepID=UPI0030D7917B|tara:strand:- start:146345 stop:146734 length:390 start_codon:yes stop_codon:yes gene_type:complete